jgi:hypothetical protein
LIIFRRLRVTLGTELENKNMINIRDRAQNKNNLSSVKHPASAHPYINVCVS